AITKEIELQELEVQISEKRIKEAKEKIDAKKAEIASIEELINDRLKDLEKATKKIDEKILKHYDRLRGSLTNGLAVVRVVRGAAEGCNIIIPPQKIAEIREKKKIVIDEHSGRILADVDLDSMKEKAKQKKEATIKRTKKVG